MSEVSFLATKTPKHEDSQNIFALMTFLLCYLVLWCFRGMFWKIFQVTYGSLFNDKCLMLNDSDLLLR